MTSPSGAAGGPDRSSRLQGRPSKRQAGAGPDRSNRLQGRPPRRGRPADPSSSRRRLRGRFRRGPLLVGVLVVALVSGLIVLAVGSRPRAELVQGLAVDAAYTGTTYGFDGLVCVGAQVVSATVDGVEVEQAGGARTQVVRAPDGAIALGFPVPEEGESLEGFTVAPGELDCSTRLLVTPQEQGQVQAGALRLRLTYGPAGLLRRTVTVDPQVSLEVTGTGRDPRAD